MTPAKINYKIYQGSTFREIYRWESQTKQYANITAITKAAPCVITAPSHTVPSGWRVRVTGVGGMKEINITSEDGYYIATSVAANQVTLNQINSSSYTTYISGGILEWNHPISLVGYTAKMQIRETVDSSTVILELTHLNGGIVLDTANYTITVNMTNVQTAAFTFPVAVYSLELTDSSGFVTTFIQGNLTLIPEVTR
ncbi:MAG: hypothetical protein EBT26_01990 [Microbacteriaceae bacterium]|nr:hypothetical protein [Microbacteriaceae bacterium]